MPVFPAAESLVMTELTLPPLLPFPPFDPDDDDDPFPPLAPFDPDDDDEPLPPELPPPPRAAVEYEEALPPADEGEDPGFIINPSPTSRNTGDSRRWRVIAVEALRR
ncbi:hypothetical protein G7Y79_00030g064560 [Physcia stellaris]|nr:hypothetical protein G7Y79_00030g064560 [Physcia stellaris]